MSARDREYRRMSLAAMRLPGDWQQRLASAHVAALAASGEVLQPPAVRKADRSVIFGGDRLASLHVRGESEAWIWLYDVDEDEAERMRLVENLERRHDNRDKLKAQLVALELRRAPAVTLGNLPIVADAEQQKKPGPPKSAKGVAREKAAEALGVTPEAVRSAEKREAARQRHDDEPEVGTQQLGDGTQPVPAPAGAAASPPAAPGLDIAVALDEVDRHLKAALAGVTKLCKAHPELVERFGVQQAKWQVKEGAAALRAMKPAAPCLYCKCWPSELPNCAACKGSGWLTEDAMKGDVPPELRILGEGEGIFVGGVFVTLADLVDVQAAAVRSRAEHARDLQRPRQPIKSIRRAGPTGQMVPSYTAPMPTGKPLVHPYGKCCPGCTHAWGPKVPIDRATRAVLEARDEDFSEAWTEGEER